MRARSGKTLRCESHWGEESGAGHKGIRRRTRPFQYRLCLRWQKEYAVSGRRCARTAECLRQFEVGRRMLCADNEPQALRSAHVGNLWKAALPGEGRVELCRTDAQAWS